VQELGRWTISTGLKLRKCEFLCEFLLKSGKKKTWKALQQSRKLGAYTNPIKGLASITAVLI